MSLISKMIRYPNEFTAMGFADSTDGSTSKTVTADETSIKNAIFDINDYFINSMGLIYVQTDGDLDITNIPSLNLGAKAKEYFKIQQFDFLAYGYRKYAFSDSYQDVNPLFLRIRYGVIQTTNLYNDPSFKARFAFTLKIDILNHNDTLIYSFYSYNIIHSGQSTSSDRPLGLVQNTTLKSMGVSNNGMIYCNIYPERVFSQQSIYSEENLYNINIPKYNRYKLNSYFHFMISRNENYIKIIDFSNFDVVSSTSATPRSTNPCNIRYFDYFGNAIYSGVESILVPFMSNTKLKNTTLPIFKTFDINSFNVVSYSENLYVTYTDLVADKLRSVITVNIDGVSKQLLCLPYDKNKNISYVNSTNLSLLVSIN